MEIRPYSSRPNLCTVIDFANAKAARAVGLRVDAHVFQVPSLHAFRVGDLVALADGAQGRIQEFKGNFALVMIAGSGIKRAAALSTLRKLPEGGGAA